MKKGKKVILAQPAVVAPSPLSRAARPVHGGVGGGGEAHRARIRYHSLLQDYQELVKETEAKKKILQMEKLKKQRILGEVNNAHLHCGPLLGLTTKSTGQLRLSGAQAEVRPCSSSEGNIPLPRASPVIDLNEACEPVIVGETSIGKLHCL